MSNLIKNTFTLKDYILHISPTICCSSPVNLFFAKYLNSNLKDEKINPTTKRAFLPFELEENNTILIILNIKYGSILYLRLDTITNKFESSNETKLLDLLNNSKINIYAICSKCENTYFSSEFLDFNTRKGFIHPVKINSERIFVKLNDTDYDVYSDYNSDKTIITAKPKGLNKPEPIDIPLTPFSKFETKQQLLEKISLYVSLS